MLVLIYYCCDCCSAKGIRRRDEIVFRAALTRRIPILMVSISSPVRYDYELHFSWLNNHTHTQKQKNRCYRVGIKSRMQQL
jgi:hypothetical protein